MFWLGSSLGRSLPSADSGMQTSSILGMLLSTSDNLQGYCRRREKWARQGITALSYIGLRMTYQSVFTFIGENLITWPRIDAEGLGNTIQFGAWEEETDLVATWPICDTKANPTHS